MKVIVFELLGLVVSHLFIHWEEIKAVLLGQIEATNSVETVSEVIRSFMTERLRNALGALSRIRCLLNTVTEKDFKVFYFPPSE